MVYTSYVRFIVEPESLNYRVKSTAPVGYPSSSAVYVMAESNGSVDSARSFSRVIVIHETGEALLVEHHEEKTLV